MLKGNKYGLTLADNYVFVKSNQSRKHWPKQKKREKSYSFGKLHKLCVINIMSAYKAYLHSSLSACRKITEI